MSLGKSAQNVCALPVLPEQQKERFSTVGKAWEWHMAVSLLCCLFTSVPAAKHQHRRDTLGAVEVSPVPCAREHWTGMAFQQGAIYGTWVLSNNQICLRSRATALGHSAIFSAINFSIYKFLLGVVTWGTILSPTSWEQYSWALMGTTEWCLASELSRGTTVRHCLHPMQHSSKRPADFSIAFPFLRHCNS